jgi:hypothetical protein
MSRTAILLRMLECAGPFSKGTLVAFRKGFIEALMDRRLIERTIEIAIQSQDFGPRALRAALDNPHTESHNERCLRLKFHS